MRRRRLLRRSKETGRGSEDVVASSRLSGRYALSDGASTSFAGRVWAKSLCWQYMQDPDIRPDWLEAARTHFRAALRPDPNDWSASMAFDRGSFATFLGFIIFSDMIVAQAVGDTVLFVASPDSRVTMIPELTAEELGRDPELLCSHAGLGTFDDTADAFARSTYKIRPTEVGWSGTRIVAVTDALARWIVEGQDFPHQTERLKQLTQLDRQEVFDAFVMQEIEAERLKRDDYTLLVLDL